MFHCFGWDAYNLRLKEFAFGTKKNWHGFCGNFEVVHFTSFLKEKEREEAAEKEKVARTNLPMSHTGGLLKVPSRIHRKLQRNDGGTHPKPTGNTLFLSCFKLKFLVVGIGFTRCCYNFLEAPTWSAPSPCQSIFCDVELRISGCKDVVQVGFFKLISKTCLMCCRVSFPFELEDDFPTCTRRCRVQTLVSHKRRVPKRFFWEEWQDMWNIAMIPNHWARAHVYPSGM